MTTRAEIEAEFEGVRDPAVLKGLARLCDTFRVTAEELSAEWDIVELNAATSRALSLDALADLEGQVKASQAQKKVRKQVYEKFPSIRSSGVLERLVRMCETYGISAEELSMLVRSSSATSSGGSRSTRSPTSRGT